MLNSKFDVNRIEWLNLVFENRNQQYGAFVLRRNSGNYLTRALLIATLFFSGIIVLSAIVSYKKEAISFVPKPDLPSTTYVFDVIPDKPVQPIKSKAANAQPKYNKTSASKSDNLPFKAVADNLVDDKISINTPTNTATTGKPINIGIGNDAILGNSVNGNVKSGAGDGLESGLFDSEVVEIMPEFPGGIPAWNKYLAKNLRYPAVALEKGTSGRVSVSFVVETNGQIRNLKILGAIGDGCDEEALRVIKKSPFWKPGFQNGRPVRVSYIMPIVFAMN